MAHSEDAIKLFGITNQLLEHDLDRIEIEYALDLRRGHRAQASGDDADYPQIERAIRKHGASLRPGRGPIAHCSPLAPDEVVRLRLSVFGWFRPIGWSLDVLGI